jgi:hypothetical protein
MGKGSKPTIGYWYRVLFHAGLGTGPIDAFLEFRGGDQTAWSGELTASGSLSINAPYLWGGEKDQGGIVGDVDVLFGEASQVPNTYLQSMLGSQVPAWRGLSTLVFKGGRYGAMNPYPQKPGFKFRKITKGWEGDACWYPEKAPIGLSNITTLPATASGWSYQVRAQQSNPGFDDLAIPASGWLEDAQGPFGGGTTAAGTNTSWPIKTVLWVRRSITVGAGAGQNLVVTAENGCLIFINGAIAGAINRENADIPNNQNNVFIFPVTAGQTYDLAIKAFDEILPTGGGTYLSVEVKAPGLTAMNPAHILYYARTHSELGREPTASMNDASFRAAADWFYNQAFGLCTAYDPANESVDQFIQRVEKVAGCSMDRSPVDGQWYLDVANGVYDLDALPILTDDDILEFGETPTTFDDAINSVSIEFFDPQTKQTVVTPPLQALALVNAYGQNPVVTTYRELPSSELALRVAQRDLLASITPSRAFELTTTRKPYAWRRNTYFRLQAPKRGIADMVCILAGSQSGTLKSGAMKITAAPDIYSLPDSSFVAVEPGVDTRPSPIPLGIVNQAVFEAPYLEVVQRLSRADLAALPDDVGYLMAVATDPSTTGSRDFSLTVSTDGGTTYASTANGDFCPSALVVEGDALSDAAPRTNFTLTGGAALSSIEVGQAAMWGSEWCRVDAIDATAGTITLGRGCADTVPQVQAANSRIWFYDVAAAADRTEYTGGESVDIELLTNTGTQQLDPSLSTSLSLTFDQRQFRPYPPANLTINGNRYPSSVSASVALAWSHRDRVLQADQLIDTLQGDVGPEAGTTYTVRVYLDGVLDSETTGITGTATTPVLSGDGDVVIAISAVRDGIESQQALSAAFAYTVSPTSQRITEAGDRRVTEAGDARALE